MLQSKHQVAKEVRVGERRTGERRSADRFISVATLARYWDVSPDTIYRDIRKGALPAYRVGSSGTIRVRLEDARRYGRPTQ